MMASLTVAQLANLCDSSFEGHGERIINGANTVEQAGPDEISFVGHASARDAAGKSSAGCLVVKADFAQTGNWALIRVGDPRAAFARLLSALYPVVQSPAFRHPSAVIASDVILARDVFIGAFVSVGSRTSIGDGCVIGSHSAIGEDVAIGSGSTLHSGVTIYGKVRIGSNVILHSGSVIGADGFGFARVGDHYEKFPQVGTVVIEDNVEIGANSCVDRGALGPTIIGCGTKLDNMVHVAHNVRIGRNVVIAAQTGFSGGVVVGDAAVIGGQVGCGDKAQIDSGAVVGSGSGILTKQRIRAGEPVWGTPARPLRQHLKGLAHVSKFGSYREELKSLREQIGALQEAMADKKKS